MMGRCGSLGIFFGYMGSGLSDEKVMNFTRYNEKDVTDIFASDNGALLFLNGNDEVFYIGTRNYVGNENVSTSPKKIAVPDDLKVKEVFAGYNAFYFLSEDGGLFCLGYRNTYGRSF